MLTFIQFTHSPITIPETRTDSREIGAGVEFHGIVRELEQGRSLAGLHYEAYEPMAVLQLERIFQRLHTEFPVAEVTFLHRLGWVPVGDSSLYLCVRSSHRAEAFAFCSAAIDAMKRDVPIWKLPHSHHNTR